MQATSNQEIIMKRERIWELFNQGLRLMEFASLGIERKVIEKKRKRIFTIKKDIKRRKKVSYKSNGVKNYIQFKSLKEFEEALSKLDELIRTQNDA